MGIWEGYIGNWPSLRYYLHKVSVFKLEPHLKVSWTSFNHRASAIIFILETCPAWLCTRKFDTDVSTLLRNTNSHLAHSHMHAKAMTKLRTITRNGCYKSPLYGINYDPLHLRLVYDHQVGILFVLPIIFVLHGIELLRRQAFDVFTAN